MVDINYKLASKHYSYPVLQNMLNDIMFNFFEDNCLQPQSMMPVKSDKEDVIYINFDAQAEAAMVQAL